ncbi:Nucleosome assembly protein 1-like 4 isoform 1 [Schistosoma japonicum]|uniref:Nucleosome assembly protein 1-like 4 isoform 1 n=1 Tax=Schistosoma japonicum TaxID=6182 RepID=A0A4Z2DHH5_SCHJA|nr:Nucleosome assembly protein 1-like 1 [Schistosoma japonicum]TNN15932.1 Nucleosome assembly protein 1-like 4 isoform 1 [Schistosoma japonicum]
MDSSKGSSKEGGEFSDSAEFHESKSDDPKLQALQEYHLLPASVKRRVRALKKLQHETLKIDSEFYKELFELEAKYDVKHQLVFKKRRDVVSGSIEPNDEECDWPTDDDDSCLDNLSERLKSTANVTKEANNEDPQSEIKGIPDFWLKTLQNISLFDEIVQEHDRDILKHLVDIKCVLHTGDSPGFTLEFYFSPNKYFTNDVLTKTYYFNYEIPKDDPFSYEGPEIVRTVGCVIYWNPGKNVTVKLVKKVQKRKSGGAKRTVTKSVREDSFFNFFSPPAQALSDELDEDTEMLLESDFKLGQFLRESVIPKAVLYFTGEAIDSEFDDDDDDEDDDLDDEDYSEGDDDDKDEDENEKENSNLHPCRGRHNRAPNRPKHNQTTNERQECPQQ